MKTWFRDNLKKTDSLLGTFDVVNGEYNITLSYKEAEQLKDVKVSFNERSKGWVSFKSFIPQQGVSIGGKYLTAVSSDIGDNDSLGKEKKGVFEHYVDITKTDINSPNFGDIINRNVFYATGTSIQCEGSSSGDCSGVPRVSKYFGESTLTVMFNDDPSLVKSFKAVNYEGSQSKIDAFTNTTGNITGPDGSPFGWQNDGEYYNLNSKTGWYVDQIITDLSFKGSVPEFIEKEGKWFNKINGKHRDEMTNKDLSEFSVQGLGKGVLIEDPGADTIDEADPIRDRPNVSINTDSDGAVTERPGVPESVILPSTVEINIYPDFIDDTSNPFAPLADNNE